MAKKTLYTAKAVNNITDEEDEMVYLVCFSNGDLIDEFPSMEEAKECQKQCYEDDQQLLEWGDITADQLDGYDILVVPKSTPAADRFSVGTWIDGPRPNQ